MIILSAQQSQQKDAINYPSKLSFILSRTYWGMYSLVFVILDGCCLVVKFWQQWNDQWSINSYNFQNYIQMNIYKRQNIQKLIVDQAGKERLILNDLIIGRDGAEVLSQLIPQYHPNLLHLEIKGNNIDSDGFQMIFMALMHCPALITIEAQWNNIGSSVSGLMALLYLVRNLRFLQTIDLKNNKLNHQHSQILAEIIKANNRSLKMLDLRWNEIGQIGAQILYPALAMNGHLKYVGLEDNRISSQTLLQINDLTKNASRGTKNASRGTMNLSIQNRTQQQQSHNPIFPISDDEYPSMDIQMKTGQLRNKIQSQQQQAALHQQKLQTQIQKAIQKIRIKGSQMHQSQLKYDSLWAEQNNLANQLRQTERLLTIEKQRFFGMDKHLLNEKSNLKNEKYHINVKIQAMMQKNIQRQQREIEDLNTVMSTKYDRLQTYLKDKINDKRLSREKLTEIKEDILKFKISKEAIWDKTTLATVSNHKNSWQQQMNAFQDLISKAQASVKSERKKGEYLSQELSNFVMRGLKKQQKLQKEIFDIQNTIKDLHREMAVSNVQIEEYQYRIILKEAEAIEKEANVDLSRRYVKYIQSQTGVNLDIERLKNNEDSKAARQTDQIIQLRMADLDRAFRQQQAQNKLIKNHYDKLLSQLEVITKNTIQAAIFQG